jgi:hypothetical protein
MSDRRLVLLGTRYPDISRMTRWRIEQEPDFPAPVIVRKRKYYYLDELEAYEGSAPPVDAQGKRRRGSHIE